MSRQTYNNLDDNPLRTVFVVYNQSDGSKWPSYLRKLFEAKGQQKITMNSLKDDKLPAPSQPERRQSVPSVHQQQAVLVVVMTSNHLKYLKSNPSANYRHLAAASQTTFAPENSCLIFLGVSERNLRDVDKSGQPLERKFDGYHLWSKFDYSTAENILDACFAMFARMDRERLDRTPSSSLTGRIVYRAIRCNEEASVVVAFDKEIPEKSTPRVHIGYPGKTSNVPVNAEILNPYTVAFRIKERFEGEANVAISIDGQPVRLLPSAQIKFVSSAADVFANSQIYIRVIEKMLAKFTTQQQHHQQQQQLLSSSTSGCSPAAEADECLARMFNPEELAAVPSRAFEEFFGVLVDVPSRSYPHPTLLHLTAEFGLKELTSKLLDLPDAKLALQMENADGKLPENLARENGHLDLANFLESYRETELDDLYIDKMRKMNTFDTDDDLLQSKVRQIKAEAVDDNVYDLEFDVKKGHSKIPSDVYIMLPPTSPKAGAAAQSPTKKTFPKSPGPENGTDFYSDLQNVMKKFLVGELDMLQTEKEYNKMKAKFQHGCQTFEQKHERTLKLRNDLQRAKISIIPEWERKAVVTKESSTSSRDFLLRKPAVFPISPSDPEKTALPPPPPPPLPTRASKGQSRAK